MVLVGLFLSFFQIGLFAFGGGMATIPFLESLSESTGWFTSIDLMNMIAISEATPGPLGINMATYIGYHVASFLGSFVSVLGMITPSIIIILGIARLLKEVHKSEFVGRIFYGLRASSVGLIFLAFFQTFKITMLSTDSSLSFLERINVFPLLLSIFIFIMIRKFHFHPICYLLFAAVCGIIFHL